jgi:hypothetical protein
VSVVFVLIVLVPLPGMCGWWTPRDSMTAGLTNALKQQVLQRIVKYRASAAMALTSVPGRS